MCSLTQRVNVHVHNQKYNYSLHGQRPNRDKDLYAEVLKWQQEIQERSVEETENILNFNLEQILEVREW